MLTDQLGMRESGEMVVLTAGPKFMMASMTSPSELCSIDTTGKM